MEIAIFIIRVVLSLLLYVFLGVLFILLWRDVKSAARQPLMTPAVREKPSRLRIVQGGDGLTDDMVLPLAPFTTLGRSEANTIVVADPYASAEHAIVAWRSGQWWLEDRQSRNGTTINGMTITQPVIVTDGDIVGIGSISFRIELEQ